MQVQTVTSRAAATGSGRTETGGAVSGGDFLSILKSRAQTEKTDRKSGGGLPADRQAGREEVKETAEENKTSGDRPADAREDLSSDKAGQAESGVKEDSDGKVKEKDRQAAGDEEAAGMQAAAQALMAEVHQPGDGDEKAVNTQPEMTRTEMAAQPADMLTGEKPRTEAPAGMTVQNPDLQKQPEESAKVAAQPETGQILKETGQLRSELKSGSANGNQAAKNADANAELLAKQVKTAETVTAGREKGAGENRSGRQDGAQEKQNAQKLFSLDHRTSASGSLKNLKGDEDVGKTGETPTVDDLQKKAEQNSFLTSMRMMGTRITGNVKAPVLDNQNIPQAMPLTDQVKAGIEQGLTKSLNEFTIRLKPEGLGEIMVHMVSSGGKIALSIGVSNTETQRLLSSEMMHLKETLQPLNAEVQEIYHNSQSGMEMMNYEQGFYQNQQNMAGNLRRHAVRYDAEDQAEEEIFTETATVKGLPSGRLSAYI